MSPGFTSFEKLRNSLMRFTAAPLCFLMWPSNGLVSALFLLVVETELNGVVAVFAGLGLDLQDAVGTGQHDGHGDQHPVGVINAGAAEFFS